MKVNNLVKQLCIGGLILAAASSSVIAFMDSRSDEQGSLHDKFVALSTIPTENSITGSIQQSPPRSNMDDYNEVVETYGKDFLSVANRNTEKRISSNHVLNENRTMSKTKANYDRRTVNTVGHKDAKAPISRKAIPDYPSQYEEKSPIISDKSTSMAKSKKEMKETTTETGSNNTQKILNNSFAGYKYGEIQNTHDSQEPVQSVGTDTVNNNPVQEEMRAQNYSVSIERDLVLGSLNEGIMNLVLSIYVDGSSPNGLIVKETIPEGWDIVESSIPYDNYNPDTGEIKWLLIGTEINTSAISYRIIKNDSSEAGSLFYGKYLYKDADGQNVDMQINYTNGV